MSIAGIGIDTERRGALDRADAATLARFQARWLDPVERGWCRRQRDERRATSTCVAAKEAVWKATGGAVELRRIVVIGAEGLLRNLQFAEVDVALTWAGDDRSVVVIAIATRRPPCR